MSTTIFCDTTVFCNFASVDRLDLLEMILNGRGRWSAAVAYEVERSARLLGDLRGLAGSGWLGEPIDIDDDVSVARIEHVRRSVFGGTRDDPLRHLGEAQTVDLIKHDPRFSAAWWATDDAEAVRWSRFQQILVKETVDLIQVGIVAGDVSLSEGYELLLTMQERGRCLRVPDSIGALRP